MTKAVQAAKRGRGVSPIYLDEDDQPEQSNVIYMRGRRRRRIVFGWYGGKFSHLDWLLPLLPKCHHYCEPFAGSGAVLINREAAPVETYNDIDGDVVNFFRVLRDRHEELIRAIALTPFSREEYHRAIYGSTSGISDVERARRFYIKARQTRTGLAQTASLGRWANCKDTSRAGMSGVVSRWLGGVDALDEIAQRLIRVYRYCASFPGFKRVADTSCCGRNYAELEYGNIGKCSHHLTPHRRTTRHRPYPRHAGRQNRTEPPAKRHAGGHGARLVQSVVCRFRSG